MQKGVDLGSVRDYISRICSTIGGRSPGSPAELKCAEDFIGQIDTILQETKHEIVKEKFSVHPGAYKTAFRLPMIFYFIILTTYWFVPWLALIFAILSYIILFGQMVLAYPVLDWLFPKKESINVTVKIKPKNPSTQVVLFGAHHDSNWEFPLMRKLGYGFSAIIGINVFMHTILLITVIIKNIFLLTPINAPNLFEIIIFYVLLAGVPFAFIHLFWLISDLTVLGANDNLSGLAICLELAKKFAKPEYQLNNVEIWISSFGCEEIGSRGSAAFVKAHLSELTNARVMMFDMVCSKSSKLSIGTSELSGMVKIPPIILQEIKESAKNLGIEIKFSPTMGYTDSLSFDRKKIPAISLITYPASSKEFYYHTRNDTLENMSLENLEPCVNLAMDFAKRQDQQDLEVNNLNI